MILLKLWISFFMPEVSFTKIPQQENWKMNYIRQVFRQKITPNLIKRKKTRRDWILALKSCRKQLEQKNVPFSCYQSLVLENYFKTRSSQDKKAILRDFDQVCLLASEQEKSLQDFLQNDFDKIKSLSAFCLELVQRKKQELLYRKYGILEK